MGWLRLVGSFKLKVTFAKEPYTRDYILQKRPIILRSLLIVDIKSGNQIHNRYFISFDRLSKRFIPFDRLTNLQRSAVPV